ncbi:unnamed protein product [Lupinus luteus]|uniref:glutaminase n=1 Tax=Lupinus luteus TaxID=3873 RepID=A0AAV1W5J4_LUPLU
MSIYRRKASLKEFYALRRLGVKGVEIKKAQQLQNVTSLIIPGGESTTMAKLAEYHNLCNRVVGGCYGDEDEIIWLDGHIFGKYQGERLYDPGYYKVS